MRSHRGLILAAMLVLSLGTFGVTSMVGLNLVDLGNAPTDSFELAYTHHDAIWIQSNQELIDQADAESWPGDGSAESPFIISGFSFDQDTQPLRIWNTDLFWIFTENLVDSDGSGMQCGTWIEDASNGVITDNIFRNRHSGLVTIDVDNVNITNNKIYGNTAWGIEFLEGISNCLVEDNRIYDCLVGGIRTEGGATNVTMIDNYVSDVSGNGITFRSATINCVVSNNRLENLGAEGLIVSLSLNTLVTHNVIINSTQNGLALHGFRYGVALNNTILNSDAEGISTSACAMSEYKNNTIQNCVSFGLEVISGENSSIMGNSVEGCSDYAVMLGEDTEYLEIKYNTFISNGAACQICDDGISNDFEYNYYNDWTSPDADADGIVDTPYSLDGEATNEDPYPVTEPGFVPTPTTTPTDQPELIPMNLLLIGAGAVAVIVVISGVIMFKRK